MSSDEPKAELPAFDPHSPGELQNLYEAEAAGLPFLVWRDAQAAQRIFALGASDRLTVGRRTSCELVLDDPHVSRVHAELKPIAGDWALLDGCMSHNGTFVNGEQIVSRRLSDGDILRFGNTHMLYRSPPRRGSMVTISASFFSDAYRRRGAWLKASTTYVTLRNCVAISTSILKRLIEVHRHRG